MIELALTGDDVSGVLYRVPDSLPTITTLNPGEGLLGAWFLATVSGFPPTFRSILVLTNQRLLLIEVVKAAERIDILGRPKGVRFVWTIRDVTRLEDISHLSAPSQTELLVDGRVHQIWAGDPHWLVSISAARESRLSRLGWASPGTPAGASTTREVHREVVKLACRYCGALTVQTESKCGACGAQLR